MSMERLEWGRGEVIREELVGGAVNFKYRGGGRLRMESQLHQ